VTVHVDRDELTESEIGTAAVRLSESISIYEALCAGDPVQRSVLSKKVLQEIGEPLDGDPIVLDLKLAHRVNANRNSLPETGASNEAAKTEERDVELRFMSGKEFRTQPLGSTEPLIGINGSALIMPHSLSLLAGIGGTGKTTLALHAAVHWAAGLPWLGIKLQRPLKLILIENEGPHDPFAEKINALCDRFKDCPCGGAPHGDVGAGFDENVTILDAPWGKFSFDDKGLSDDLNAQAKEFEADLIIANPLGRLGMRGAGTPEETRGFVNLLTHAGLFNDFGCLLIHHMAKGKQASLSQQISGDWGGHPDTILILEQAGAQRSKLTFEKNRWGDQGAREPIILNWLTDPKGPVGYKTAETPQGIADETVQERIDTYLRQQSKPSGITKIRESVPGQGKRIKDLIERGISDGRYSSSGGVRPRYWLNETAQGVQETIIQHERKDLDG
jgi:hypothetical protein